MPRKGDDLGDDWEDHIKMVHREAGQEGVNTKSG